MTSTSDPGNAVGITSTGLGGYDSVWGDIDLDGDLDLINPNNSNNSERVYINDARPMFRANHWLYVKLHGPGWNTTGIGSSLYATLDAGTPNEVTLRREANTNAGTFNQSDLPVQFGLGAVVVRRQAAHSLGGWHGTSSQLRSSPTNIYP